jgi:hypothetical protein
MNWGAGRGENRRSREEGRGPGKPNGLRPQAPERRAAPRFRCVGNAQVREEHHDTYTWGAITDISLHGCYLEMAAVLPVGAIVFLQVEIANERLILKGEVRAVYPFLGMGIAFRDMTSADQVQLSKIVHVLTSEGGLAAPAHEEEDELLEMCEVPDAGKALNYLKGFFQVRGVLTRAEFAGMLRRLAEEAPKAGGANSSEGGEPSAGAPPVHNRAMGRGSGA